MKNDLACIRLLARSLIRLQIYVKFSTMKLDTKYTFWYTYYLCIFNWRKSAIHWELEDCVNLYLDLNNAQRSVRFTYLRCEFSGLRFSFFFFFFGVNEWVREREFYKLGVRIRRDIELRVFLEVMMPAR